MHREVKKLFTIFLSLSFILPSFCESIIFNIAYSNNNYISIYFTQKDRRNYLLVEYLSEKRQELLLFSIFTFISIFNFYIFLSRHLITSPIKFSERVISFPKYHDLKILIKIKIRVTRI